MRQGGNEEQNERARGLYWHMEGRADQPRPQPPGQAPPGDPRGENWHREGHSSWSRLQQREVRLRWDLGVNFGNFG